MNAEKGCISIKPDLNTIINNSYDAIFVTDKVGNILLVNPAACKLLETPMEKLVGSNVRKMVETGVFQPSMTLRAIAEKRMVTGLVRTKSGLNLMSTSMPLIDDGGNVILVITNSRDKDLVDKFIETIKQERALTHKYKSEVEFLRDRNIEKGEVVVASKLMDNVVERAMAIAKADATVMLYGESGTGKELIAKYIHKHSARAQEPFIEINCAAIPENLLEAELFGYQKGAFTGANAHGKPGLFELADKGTLFLDEIGEMPLTMQSKLLRVLENYEIRRVGGTAVRRVDARIIAATNRDLKKAVNEKRFREDLYYRLNVIPIVIPSLRERREDIAVLAEHFLSVFNKKHGYDKEFAQDTIEAMMNYRWPGNVRELRNLVERMVITSPERVIHPEWISQGIRNGNGAAPWSIPAVKNKGEKLKDATERFEREYINKALEECGGNMSEAARRLGIHRTVMYRKLK